MNRRQARALATVVLLSGGLATFGSPALGEEIRTMTGLGGFSVSTNAAPFKTLIDDPSNPLPRPPEEAIVEADPSFTLAQVATGPASRGLASSLWPGNLLGEGIGAASNGQLPGYAVKADARYPDKPYTAQDQSGGSAMRGSAMGLDASATALSGPLSIPGSVDIGSITSTTTATVDKTSMAIGHSTSRVSDISLLGVIKIGSVSTVVETRSDGKKQAATGKTVVSGLSVAGQSYVVDEQGARPAGGAGTGPLPLGQLDVAKAVGITISGVSQTGRSDAGGVVRDAKGLRITVDTTMYRAALTSNTPGPVTDALYQAFGGIPLPPQAATYRSFLYYTLSATPKITFVLGAATSFTVANLPLSFAFPTFPTTTPPLFPPGTTPGLVPAGAPVPGGAPIAAVAPPAITGEVPVVAQPALTAASGSDPPAPFGGIGALLVLGAGVLAGFGGWGLLRLQGMALVGALAGGGCTLGAPSSVPDLRGATA